MVSLAAKPASYYSKAAPESAQTVRALRFQRLQRGTEDSKVMLTGLQIGEFMTVYLAVEPSVNYANSQTYVIIKCLIPKLWDSVCCYNSLCTSMKAFQAEGICSNSAARALVRSASDVG